MAIQNSANLAGGGVPEQAGTGTGEAMGGAVPGQGMENLLPALKEVLQASMDQQGFVDLNKLVQLWPQVAQKYGLQMTVEQLMQMVQQDPDAIEPILQELGIVGIMKDGKQITGEELAGQTGGGSMQGPSQMAGGGAMPPQGMA